MRQQVHCPRRTSQIERRVRSQQVRPDLVDRDFAPAIECSTDSTPQIAIVESNPCEPTSACESNQVIAVRTNDQIAQGTFQQLKESPHFCTVRALQFSRKRPKKSTPGRRTLRERHLARDAHCAPTSSDKSRIIAIFPAVAVYVPIQRVVSNEVAWRGSTSCSKDHCRRLRGWRRQQPHGMRNWEKTSEPQARSVSCLSLSST